MGADESRRTKRSVSGLLYGSITLAFGLVVFLRGGFYDHGLREYVNFGGDLRLLGLPLILGGTTWVVVSTRRWKERRGAASRD